MSDKLTMKELPNSEQPYEKAYTYGAQVLSDAELLAVILRTGSREKTSVLLAQDVLMISEVYDGLLGLYHCDVRDLMKIDGIGKVKAVQLICVAELAKRMARQIRKKELGVTGPRAVASFFMEEMRVLEEEHLYVAYLDVKGGMLKHEVLFSGSVNLTGISPREICKHALRYDAAQVIILHNHPSGDPEPSDADIKVTGVIKDALELIGIRLTDHIIIGDNRYVSLATSGVIERI